MSTIENDPSSVAEDDRRYGRVAAQQTDGEMDGTEETDDTEESNGTEETETDDGEEMETDDGEEMDGTEETGDTEEAESIEFVLNGNEVTFTGDTEKPLLYVLRNDAELNGPKFGCGLAQCGSCDVIVDGSTTVSCVTPVSDVEGSEVTTTRGLGTREDPHPVQEAFIDTQAAQCGYCIHGMMMEATALLEENPDPSDDEIREALAENLCRCGTHPEIMAAVRQAAEEMS